MTLLLIHIMYNSSCTLRNSHVDDLALAVTRLDNRYEFFLVFSVDKFEGVALFFVMILVAEFFVDLPFFGHVESGSVVLPVFVEGGVVGLDVFPGWEMDYFLENFLGPKLIFI